MAGINEKESNPNQAPDWNEHHEALVKLLKLDDIASIGITKNRYRDTYEYDAVKYLIYDADERSSAYYSIVDEMSDEIEEKFQEFLRKHIAELHVDPVLIELMNFNKEAFADNVYTYRTAFQAVSENSVVVDGETYYIYKQAD